MPRDYFYEIQCDHDRVLNQLRVFYELSLKLNKKYRECYDERIWRLYKAVLVHFNWLKEEIDAIDIAIDAMTIRKSPLY